MYWLKPPLIKFWRARNGGGWEYKPPMLSKSAENPASTLPSVWNFFWSSSNCCATKIVIWLFGWNSPVHWTITENLQTGWVVDILFWNSPSGIFRFVTLPLEIPEKAKFHPWKFCKIVCQPLEIPRSKTKTQENFTLVFLYKTAISSIFFNCTLGFPCALSSIPLEWKFHVFNPWLMFGFFLD